MSSHWESFHCTPRHNCTPTQAAPICTHCHLPLQMTYAKQLKPKELTTTLLCFENTSRVTVCAMFDVHTHTHSFTTNELPSILANGGHKQTADCATKRLAPRPAEEQMAFPNHRASLPWRQGLHTDVHNVVPSNEQFQFYKQVLDNVRKHSYRQADEANSHYLRWVLLEDILSYRLASASAFQVAGLQNNNFYTLNHESWLCDCDKSLCNGRVLTKNEFNLKRPIIATENLDVLV